MYRERRNGRKGSVLPLVALSVVGILSFTALSVDLGMIAVARTQVQNAADSAAMAGVRSLNGDVTNNNNYTAALPSAVTGATSNFVLSQPISSTDVSISIGSYTYDRAQDKFISSYTTKPTNENWSLVHSQVSVSGQTAFARVFHVDTFSTTATATAVHRPRDIAIVLDFSGSMRFASLSGLTNSGARTASGNTPSSGTNNPESIFPKFGHYSVISTAGLQRTTPATLGGDRWVLCNFTEQNSLSGNRPPIVADFYQHLAGSSPSTPAFTSAGDGDSEGYIAGDRPWKTNYNAGATYAQHAAQITNLASPSNGHAKDNTWETNGYGNTFAGYTRGPRYWGKTFFIWPPDPRDVTNASNQLDNGAKDWRKKFFLKSDMSTPVDDNSLLWNTSGVWLSPRITTSGVSTDYYRVNYRAILNWIRNTGPNPFPPRLRAGRLTYYTAIPDPAADTTINTRWNSNSTANDNERFWKLYIDYVLGIYQTGTTSWDASSGTPSVTNWTGYGADFTWGTLRVTANSSLTASPKPYMRYDDNPLRPRTHFWFGPMSMVDFLGNYNLGLKESYNVCWWWPGTCHEAPLYACKLGIRGALQDIENNHPNDLVSLIMFSHPRSSASDSDKGRRFNRVRVPLGKDYTRMIDSLWYPPYTIENPGTELTIFDWEKNKETPRAMGSTCYSMGLMLAFNQFSTETSLKTYNPSPAPDGDAGGLGRRGAQKIVVFETDGLPNHTATASFTNNGSHRSYYRIRYNSTTPSSSEYPSVNSYSDNSSTVTTQIYNICTQLVASETASTPGYSSTRKPALIHTIAFGDVVEPTNPDRAAAIATLSQMETIGNIPADKRIGTNTSKLVYGSTDQEIIDKLRTAIAAIMQDGVQVTLIE